MQGHAFNTDQLHTLFEERLQHISGVKFTEREVDVLTFVIHHRGSKRIAVLLDISPRTVETHIRNILLKIGGNSREDIVEFVTRARVLDSALAYYQLWVSQKDFEHYIKALQDAGGPKKISYQILGQDQNPLAPFLVSILDTIGMKAVEEGAKITFCFKAPQNTPNPKTIYFISSQKGL